MAMTGFFYTFTRPRTSTPLSMLKYDPVGGYILIIFGVNTPWIVQVLTAAPPSVRRKVLFLEKKRSAK